MNRVCIFCGSNAGNDAAYHAAACDMGELLGRRGIGIVYGGGHVGLMGAVADGALAVGGSVIGVIPMSLWEREVGHNGLTELRIVSSMHERKAMMADLADAFIALPGGLGTLEELFEVWTWGQLGLHAKPFGLLNVAGYFDPLLEFLKHGVDSGFVRAEHYDMMISSSVASDLIDRLGRHEPVLNKQWIEQDDT